MNGEQGELNFTFEGKTVSAQPGQSIAGALHKTGVRTLARGIKYHRPRGYTCGFGACGDCPLRIDGMPATVSCTTPVRGNEQVRREIGTPHTRFDVLRGADFLRPFLRAGFQFKLFARQPRLSRFAGRGLAWLAGGGRIPSSEAAERAQISHAERVDADVLVVGGGISGMTAALTAADSGAHVVLVDHEGLGGRARVRTERIRRGDGVPVVPRELCEDALARVRQHPGIQTLHGTAIGWIDGVVPVVQETDRRRSDVHAARVVLATGSYETPIPVPGHDLPGVILADGALRLAVIEGVRPGKRAVVVDGDPRAAEVARELERHGVSVVATVPAALVERVIGWGRARGVKLRRDSAPGASARATTIRADLVCMVGPRRPADELMLHVAYAAAGSHEDVRRDVDARDPAHRSHRVTVVGSAAGNAAYDLVDIEATVRSLTDPRSTVNADCEPQ